MLSPFWEMVKGGDLTVLMQQQGAFNSQQIKAAIFPLILPRKTQGNCASENQLFASKRPKQRESFQLKKKDCAIQYFSDVSFVPCSIVQGQKMRTKEKKHVSDIVC